MFQVTLQKRPFSWAVLMFDSFRTDAVKKTIKRIMK